MSQGKSIASRGSAIEKDGRAANTDKLFFFFFFGEKDPFSSGNSCCGCARVFSTRVQYWIYSLVYIPRQWQTFLGGTTVLSIVAAVVAPGWESDLPSRRLSCDIIIPKL